MTNDDIAMDTGRAIRPAASGHEAAAAAGGDLVVGRARIAAALDRSPRTVSRWLRAGILTAAKIGPHSNNALIARRADLERLAAVPES